MGIDFNLEEAKKWKLRYLRNSTRRIKFEFDSGEEFYVIGGKDRRRPPEGVACFSPSEMMYILNEKTSVEIFLELIAVKRRLPGSYLICNKVDNQEKPLKQQLEAMKAGF